MAFSVISTIVNNSDKFYLEKGEIGFYICTPKTKERGRDLKKKDFEKKLRKYLLIKKKVLLLHPLTERGW